MLIRLNKAQYGPVRPTKASNPSQAKQLLQPQAFQAGSLSAFSLNST